MDLDRRIAGAVRHYWQTRESQKSKQGTASGVQDYGACGRHWRETDGRLCGPTV